jgi:hypothetical protein
MFVVGANPLGQMPEARINCCMHFIYSKCYSVQWFHLHGSQASGRWIAEILEVESR